MKVPHEPRTPNPERENPERENPELRTPNPDLLVVTKLNASFFNKVIFWECTRVDSPEVVRGMVLDFNASGNPVGIDFRLR